MLPRSTCQGHFFSWREPIKTTWKLRLAALILLLVFAMHGVWISRLGQSLVCPEGIALSDLILVENFDPNFLVFERAAQLHHAGWASRVLNRST